MAIRLPPLSHLVGRVHLLRLFVNYVAGRYRKDRASSVAASLAYTSLLSLVPLLAIALAMLAAFPVFSPLRVQIENWIFINFVPAIGHVVQDQISLFIANAGRLSAAGIVGLGVTAIMLLVTVETAFNHIFRVDRHRSALSRLLVYWTILTLGPLLVGASLSLESYFSALPFWHGGGTVWADWAALLPTLTSMMLFAVMYAAIPNRPVPPMDAATGGVAAGLLFALLRWGFGYYIASSQAYTTVYGAVAVVPIVLFWMFLSWVIVLIGAETTAALAEWRSGYAQHTKSAHGERRLTLALAVLYLLYQASRTGQRGCGRRHLLTHTQAGEAELMGVVRKLYRGNLVTTDTHGHVILAHALDCLSLKDLVVVLDLELGLDAQLAAKAPWREHVLPALAQAHRDVDQALGVTLAHLFRDQPPL